MRRAQRLRRRQEFAEVYRRGRRFHSDLLVLRTLKTNRPLTRFGFAVSRAVGGAVVRNRVKRRLREAARSLPVAPGWDVVMNARTAAAQASYDELRRTLSGLLAKAKLLEAEADS